MRYGKRWPERAVIAAVLSFLLILPVSAAEPGAIVGSDTEGEKIVLYVQNPGELKSLQCQVGTAACDQITYQPVSDLDKPVHTIILVDNSLSVDSEYRPLINDIISNLAANRMAGEVFSLACFSDSLNYLVEESSDYTQIKQAADGIVYEDQETYLTDVLYDLLESLNSGEDTTFKRIIIFSDGVDNKTVGYTKEELYALLRSHAYPIYTLGCSNKSGSNGEELKNMSALSRQTQGQSWMLNEVADSLQVAGAVAEGNDVLRVEITPPAEVCDGTEKGIRLTMAGGEGEKEASIVVKMPFGTVENKVGAEETEKHSETENVTLPGTSEKPAGKEGGKALLYLSAAAVLILLASAIGVMLVRFLRVRREKDEFEPVLPGGAITEPERISTKGAVSPTEVVGSVSASDTAVIWGDKETVINLILSDQKNPARRFEVPLNKTIMIGRDRDRCQVVLDYEKSVSNHHCDILQEDKMLYVVDHDSTNKTYLDGCQVIGKVQIHSGSVLTLGRLSMKVEIR